MPCSFGPLLLLPVESRISRPTRDRSEGITSWLGGGAVIGDSGQRLEGHVQQTVYNHAKCCESLDGSLDMPFEIDSRTCRGPLCGFSRCAYVLGEPSNRGRSILRAMDQRFVCGCSTFILNSFRTFIVQVGQVEHESENYVFLLI